MIQNTVLPFDNYHTLANNMNINNMCPKLTTNINNIFLYKDIIINIQEFTDINNLLNTNKEIFSDIKKNMYVWRLNHRYSEEYINNKDFRKLLNDKINNKNKQIYHLHLNKIKNIDKCQFIKSLNFDHSRIKNLDILNQFNLYDLNLKNCKNLVNIDALENQKNLQKLRLPDYSSQNKNVFSKLTNLQHLEINIKTHNDIIALSKLTQLLSLNINRIYFNQNDISELTKLINLRVLSLDASYCCNNIAFFIDTLLNFKILHTLKIYYLKMTNNELDSILNNLTNLTELSLYSCIISNSINIYGNIKIFKIYSNDVESINIFCKLTKLILKCKNLKNIIMSNTDNLSILQTLSISYCDKLENINIFNNLLNLHTLILSICEELELDDLIFNNLNLYKLSLEKCQKFDINKISYLNNLHILHLESCDNIVSIDIHNRLSKLSITKCKKLNNVNIFNGSNLNTICIYRCTKLENINSFENLINLHTLILNCDYSYTVPNNIIKLNGFYNLINLYELEIYNYCKYININDFGNLINLHHLKLNIEYNIDLFVNLINLEELKLEDCKIDFNNIIGFENLTNLCTLYINGYYCNNLKNIIKIIPKFKKLNNLSLHSHDFDISEIKGKDKIKSCIKKLL